MKLVTACGLLIGVYSSSLLIFALFHVLMSEMIKTMKLNLKNVLRERSEFEENKKVMMFVSYIFRFQFWGPPTKICGV